MSDYHDFGFSLQLRDRIIDPITEDENGKIVRTQNKFLPFPENAKEGAIGLHYYYLSDRPSMDFYFKQRNRNGVIFDIEKFHQRFMVILITQNLALIYFQQLNWDHLVFTLV